MCQYHFIKIETCFIFWFVYNISQKEAVDMNIFELMDMQASSFSKTDRRIYEAIKKFPDSFAEQSITEISENSGFSKPALSRFAKKLDFGGFAEFQYQFSQELKTRKEVKTVSSNADIYGSLLKQTAESAAKDEIPALIEKMKEARQVYIFGSNLSRMPAEMLYITLQFEKEIVPVLPPNDVPPYVHSKENMYIVYSALSGDSHQNLMRELRKNKDDRPYLVLITTNSKHPLRHNFDTVIVLPSVSLASGNQIVFSDTFAFMMFNDMLQEYLHH